jgi:hypothetical protein
VLAAGGTRLIALRSAGFNNVDLASAEKLKMTVMRVPAYSPEPLGQYKGIPRADPGGRVTPRFRHRLIRFRRFHSGSLALASLDRACRDHARRFRNVPSTRRAQETARRRRSP